MSVPLDRLYNFVDSLCGGDVIIYRFNPHGSKKITDLGSLRPLHTYGDLARCMICHDQEPLDYAYYSDPQRLEELLHIGRDDFVLLHSYRDQDSLDKVRSLLLKKNLKMIDHKLNGQSLVFLLHSEKNSAQLDVYERSGFIGVYWWSHAVIARDWFRYAQHDPDLDHKHIQRDFLIYNRAWSGTREYRLKFAELIIQKKLQPYCDMKFNPQDSGQHYQKHIYRNPAFSIHTALQDHFALNDHDSTASADYVGLDYTNTAIEVVLETLFDDNRLHLTEKILRPIACGQPFILCAPTGALAYLRSYGFRTFDPLIDESYDRIQDPVARLQDIVHEMRRIADLASADKTALFDHLHEIAACNREWFFSSQFQHRIVNEFRVNLAQANARLVGS